MFYKFVLPAMHALGFRKTFWKLIDRFYPIVAEDYPGTEAQWVEYDQYYEVYPGCMACLESERYDDHIHEGDSE